MAFDPSYRANAAECSFVAFIGGLYTLRHSSYTLTPTAPHESRGADRNYERQPRGMIRFLPAEISPSLPTRPRTATLAVEHPVQSVVVAGVEFCPPAMSTDMAPPLTKLLSAHLPTRSRA
jgi:hypothetical protein